MSPSQNRFSVVALIQALECELAWQIETEPSGIYDAYTASRRKVLEEVVAKLRQVSPGDDSLVFGIRFGSALIARIKKQTAYSRQPLTDVERGLAFGELSGLRTALKIFRRLGGIVHYELHVIGFGMSKIICKPYKKEEVR